MTTRKYDGVLKILETAQGSIQNLLPNCPLPKTLPNTFDSDPNQKLAQSIYLMVDRLHYHGENDCVYLTSFAWNSLSTLKSCIGVLQDGQSLPIPNLNQADDTTFKLSVIYLSVLKGLDIQICADAKDYIGVLGASRDFLDDLTLYGPAELTKNLINYYKAIPDAEIERKEALLAFVTTNKLDELKDFLTSDTQIKALGETLEKINSFAQMSIVLKTLVIFHRKFLNVKLNRKGHQLLVVENEADISVNLSIDMPTLVKIKSTDTQDVVRVYRCEWPKTFGLQLSEAPTQLNDLPLSEEDKEYYQAGIILVKNNHDSDQVFYVDRTQNTIEPLQEITNQELELLNQVFGSSSAGKCINMSEAKLRQLSSIEPNNNLWGKKFIYFTLDANLPSISKIKFPSTLDHIAELPYQTDTDHVYEHIIDAYNHQISMHRPKIFLTIEQKIERLQNIIQDQSNKIKALAKDIFEIENEENRLLQEKAELEQQLGLQANLGTDRSPSQLSIYLNQILFNISCVSDSSTYVSFFVKNWDEECFNKIVALQSNQRQLTENNNLRASKNAALQLLNADILKNECLLLKLEINQAKSVQLNPLSKEMDNYKTQMQGRLNWLNISEFLNFSKYYVAIKRSIAKTPSWEHQLHLLKNTLATISAKASDLMERLGENASANKQKDSLLKEVSSIDELMRALTQMMDQDLQIQKIETSAAKLSSLLKRNALRMNQKLFSFNMMLLNSKFLPYLAILAGAVALTISMGILLSNPHFAVFIIPAILGITNPLAITGAAVGGTVALLGAAAIGYQCFFKPKTVIDGSTSPIYLP